MIRHTRSYLELVLRTSRWFLGNNYSILDFYDSWETIGRKVGGLDSWEKIEDRTGGRRVEFVCKDRTGGRWVRFVGEGLDMWERIGRLDMWQRIGRFD